MNVIIGGTGFVGTALSRALVENGERVVSVSRSGEGGVPGVQYEHCDVADVERLNEIVKDGENIFILTGQIGPDFDAEKEKKNLRGLANILSRFPEKKVFFASSVYVYGNTDSPADETHPCHPIEPYSVFKLDAERLLRESLPKNDLMILRFANIYGSPKNRGIIGLVMKKLVEPDGNPLRINGDGHQQRDYVFIDDVVDAVMAIKERSHGSDTINVASGESVSLLEVVAKISELSGKEIPHEVTNSIPNEIRNMYVSNGKLKSVYGYEPKTKIENGLRKTLERYREIERDIVPEFQFPKR